MTVKTDHTPGHMTIKTTFNSHDNECLVELSVDGQRIAPSRVSAIVSHRVAIHDELVAALKTCDDYWNACVRVWEDGDGRVGRATTGGAVVVGHNLDVLAEEAAIAIKAALANAGVKP